MWDMMAVEVSLSFSGTSREPFELARLTSESEEPECRNPN